jgi:hypothetical protein
MRKIYDFCDLKNYEIKEVSAAEGYWQERKVKT